MQNNLYFNTDLLNTFTDSEAKGTERILWNIPKELDQFPNTCEATILPGMKSSFSPWLLFSLNMLLYKLIVHYLHQKMYLVYYFQIVWLLLKQLTLSL
jgi:hypothetical protein